MAAWLCSLLCSTACVLIFKNFCPCLHYFYVCVQFSTSTHLNVQKALCSLCTVIYEGLMSLRTHHQGEKSQESNIFTVEVPFSPYREEENENDREFCEMVQVDREDDDATPVVRPVSSRRKGPAVSLGSVKAAKHMPSDSEISLDSVDSPASILSDKNFSSKESETPSRLLTISSLDFKDSEDIHPIFRDGSSDNGERLSDECTATNDGGSVFPLSRFDVDGIESEIGVHGNIVIDFANKLSSSVQQHLREVVKNVISQKDSDIHRRDDFYTSELQKQQMKIEELEDIITSYEKEKRCKDRLLENCYKRMASHFCKTREQFSSQFSALRIFQEWKMFVQESKKMSKVYNLASKRRNFVLLKNCFKRMKNVSDMAKANRRTVEGKRQFDKTIRDLVKRYEKQIAILNGELTESQECLAQEKSRRQQLEEDLRRMFLKNMTVLNMEALSLFQTPASAPPQLAEFGPKKVASDRKMKRNIEQKKQENMMREMKNQQHELQWRHQREQAKNLHSMADYSEEIRSTSSNNISDLDEREDVDKYPRESPMPTPYK